MTTAAPASRPGLPDPKLGEPFLLTPGPLTTAFSTKEAMLRDWGSWDADFRAMTKSLCEQLVALACDPAGEWACVPMQGSGTFAVRSMLGTFLPRDGKALVLANGAYGLRAAETLRVMGRAFALIDKGTICRRGVPRWRRLSMRIRRSRMWWRSTARPPPVS